MQFWSLRSVFLLAGVPLLGGWRRVDDGLCEYLEGFKTVGRSLRKGRYSYRPVLLKESSRGPNPCRTPINGSNTCPSIPTSSTPEHIITLPTLYFPNLFLQYKK